MNTLKVTCPECGHDGQVGRDTSCPILISDRHGITTLAPWLMRWACGNCARINWTADTIARQSA